MTPARHQTPHGQAVPATGTTTAVTNGSGREASTSTVKDGAPEAQTPTGGGVPTHGLKPPMPGRLTYTASTEHGPTTPVKRLGQIGLTPVGRSPRHARRHHPAATPTSNRPRRRNAPRLLCTPRAGPARAAGLSRQQLCRLSWIDLPSAATSSRPLPGTSFQPNIGQSSEAAELAATEQNRHWPAGHLPHISAGELAVIDSCATLVRPSCSAPGSWWPNGICICGGRPMAPTRRSRRDLPQHRGSGRRRGSGQTPAGPRFDQRAHPSARRWHRPGRCTRDLSNYTKHPNEPDDHASSRSCGGLTTTIHALATAGLGHRHRDRHVSTLGRQGTYSHDSTRAQLRRRKISHTIPERSDQIDRRKAKSSKDGRASIRNTNLQTSQHY